MLIDEVNREVFDLRGMVWTKAEIVADKIGATVGETVRKRNVYHSGDVVYHPRLNVYRIYSGNVKKNGYYVYRYIEIDANENPIELLFKLWGINGIVKYWRGTYARVELYDSDSLKKLMEKFDTDTDERHNEAPPLFDLIYYSEYIVRYSGYLILQPREDALISIDEVEVKIDGMFEFIKGIDAGEPDSIYCDENSGTVVMWWD